MSKNVRLNIETSVDTGQSEQQIKKLAKGLDELKGKGQIIDSKGNVIGGLGDESSKPAGGVGEIQNDLLKAIERLTEANDTIAQKLTDISETMYSAEKPKESTPKGSSDTQPRPEDPEKATGKKDQPDPPTPGDRNRDKDSESLGSIVGKVASAIFAGGFLKNYVGEGVNQSLVQQLDAMSIYNRTNLYGSDFRRARRDAYETGIDYGYDARETMMVQDRLLSETGFTDKESLDSDTQAMLGLDLAYGLDPSETTGGFGRLVRSGAYESGDAQDYANVISASIRATGMQGRESEQVRAINKIADILTDGNLQVSNEAFDGLVNMHAILGSLNESLKGERGAELLGKMQGIFDTSDEFGLRLFGYGNVRGYGPEGLWDTITAMDRGYAEPENFATFTDNVEQYFHGGIDGVFYKMWLRNATGASADEVEEAIKAQKVGDAEGFANSLDIEIGEEAIKSAVENVQDSAVMQANIAEINAQEANIGLGDEINEALKPVKEFYNQLPSILQGSLSVGGGMLGSIFKGGLLGVGAEGAKKVISSLFGRGASATGKATAGKGIGGIASGLGAGAKVGSGSSMLTGAGLGASAGAGAVLGPLAIAGTLGIGSAKIIDDNLKFRQKRNEGTLTEDEFYKSLQAHPHFDELQSAYIYKDRDGNYTDKFYEEYDKVMGSYATGIDYVPEDNHLAYLHRGERVLTKQEADEYRDSTGLMGTKSAEDNEKKKTANLALEETLLKDARRILENFFDDKDQDFISENPSDFYNKYDESNLFNEPSLSDEMGAYMGGDDSALGSDGGEGTFVGNDKKERFYNFYKSLGYTDSAIAGMWGNVMQESNANPNAINKSSGASGLYQHLGSRLSDLKNFASQKGTSWNDAKTQMQFAHEELMAMGGGKDYAFTDGSPRDKAVWWRKEFERPHESEANDPARIKHANSFYKGIGSYAVGIDRVQEDNELAFLHKDEAVLNRFEADQWRRSKNEISSLSGANMDVNINIEGKAETDQDIEQLVMNAILQALQKAGINNNGVNLNRSFTRTPN